MNFKEQLFLDNLVKDCYLAASAIFCVVLVVVVAYNVWFSTTLIIGMLLSIGVAFFIYVVGSILNDVSTFLDCASNQILPVHQLVSRLDRHCNQF